IYYSWGLRLSFALALLLLTALALVWLERAVVTLGARGRGARRFAIGIVAIASVGGAALTFGRPDYRDAVRAHYDANVVHAPRSSLVEVEPVDVAVAVAVGRIVPPGERILLPASVEHTSKFETW